MLFVGILECIKFVIGLMMLMVIIWSMLNRIGAQIRNEYVRIAYIHVSNVCYWLCKPLKPLLILDQIDYTPILLIFVLWMLQKIIDIAILLM